MLPTLGLILLSLLMTQNSVDSIQLDCKFRFDGWDFAVKNAYICHAEGVNITSSTVITSVNGTHVPAQNDDRVTALLIREQKCEFFPGGINSFFSNIEGIAIQDSGLKVIRKSDLLGFPNLKSLSLFGNLLSTLEFKLLMYNRKLEFFSVFNNKIVSVGEDLFKDTVNITQIHMTGNKCIDQSAMNEKEIAALKEKLHKNCPSSIEMKNAYDMEVKLELTQGEMLLKESKIRELEVLVEVCAAESEISVTTIIPATENSCDQTCQELSDIVKKFDIECDDFYESSCIANDVIVQHKDMEPKNMRLTNESIIDPEKILELQMQGKHIHFMPQKLGIFFKNLKNLTIINTKISKIDDTSLNKLDNLQYLELSYNKIHTIDKHAFDDLKSCEFLDISFNKFTEIPQSFGSIYSLKQLNLEGNQISILHWRAFENLGNLQVLKINSNRLKQIGSNLKMENLKELDLSENICVDLKYPDIDRNTLIQTFADNCTIDVEMNCEYKAVDDDYICIASNFDIDSENVKISRIIGQHVLPKKSIKDVTVFSVINQNLQYIPQNLQQLFSQLKKLEIVSSNLQKLIALNNLESIKISGNSLKAIEIYTFINSSAIKYIDLSNNEINNIPNNLFEQLKNLSYLNLNGNSLKAISSNLVSSENSIKEFYCNNNKIEKIENNFIKKLKKATVVEIKENTCVDNKYHKESDNSKKFLELYGEVDLNC